MAWLPRGPAAPPAPPRHLQHPNSSSHRNIGLQVLAPSGVRVQHHHCPRAAHQRACVDLSKRQGRRPGQGRGVGSPGAAGAGCQPGHECEWLPMAANPGRPSRSLTRLWPICHTRSPATPRGSCKRNSTQPLRLGQLQDLACAAAARQGCNPANRATPPIQQGPTWLMAITSLAFRIARLSGWILQGSMGASGRCAQQGRRSRAVRSYCSSPSIQVHTVHLRRSAPMISGDLASAHSAKCARCSPTVSFPKPTAGAWGSRGSGGVRGSKYPWLRQGAPCLASGCQHSTPVCLPPSLPGAPLPSPSSMSRSFQAPGPA